MLITTQNIKDNSLIYTEIKSDLHQNQEIHQIHATFKNNKSIKFIELDTR